MVVTLTATNHQKSTGHTQHGEYRRLDRLLHRRASSYLTGSSPVTPSVQFLTALSDHEFADIDEYLEKADQKSHAKAGALLEKISSPVQVTLCCEDGVSKVVLTVASDRGPKDSVLSWYEGVLSVRIES